MALTDEDKYGRNLVVSWMQNLGLDITIDVVGNIVGVWNVGHGAPVMSGSHIDTVRTGGRFDGCYGVLAALEVIESCQDAKISPPRPLAVGVFTDVNKRAKHVGCETCAFFVGEDANGQWPRW